MEPAPVVRRWLAIAAFLACLGAAAWFIVRAKRDSEPPPLGRNSAPGMTSAEEMWETLPPEIQAAMPQGPVQGMTVAEQQGLAKHEPYLVYGVAQYLLLKDFGCAKDVLPFLENKASREPVVSLAVQHALRLNPLAAVQDASEIRGPGREEALLLCVRQALSAGDVPLAMSAQLKMAPSPLRRDAVTSVATGATKVSTDELFAWWDELPTNADRQAAVPAIGARFFQRGTEKDLERLWSSASAPSGAFYLWGPVGDVLRQQDFRALREMRERIFVMRYLFRSRAGDEAGAEALLGPLGDLDADRVRVDAYNDGKSFEVFLRDVKAIRFPHLQSNMTQRYFSTNAAGNPVGWAEKALTVDDSIFESAIGAVISTAMRVKPQPGLRNWIQALPPGFHRDVASERFSYFNLHFPNANQAFALEAADWIADPVRRERAKQQLHLFEQISQRGKK